MGAVIAHSPDAVIHSPAAWPDGGHQLAMPASLDAENTETVLGVVKGDMFDKAHQNLPSR
jgi:hypothetical protein